MPPDHSLVSPPLKLTPGVHDTLVSAFGLGVSQKQAAAVAGITPRALMMWLAFARVALEGLDLSGEIDLGQFDEPVRPCVALLLDLERAKAGRLVEALATVRQAHQGYATVETTTTTVQVPEKIKDADGSERVVMVDKTTTTTKQGTARHWQAAAWWAERNFPDQFALKNRFEVSGPDSGPIEIRPVAERAERVVAEIRERLDAVAPLELEAAPEE